MTVSIRDLAKRGLFPIHTSELSKFKGGALRTSAGVLGGMPIWLCKDAGKAFWTMDAYAESFRGPRVVHGFVILTF